MKASYLQCNFHFPSFRKCHQYPGLSARCHQAPLRRPMTASISSASDWSASRVSAPDWPNLLFSLATVTTMWFWWRSFEILSSSQETRRSPKCDHNGCLFRYMIDWVSGTCVISFLSSCLLTIDDMEWSWRKHRKRACEHFVTPDEANLLRRRAITVALAANTTKPLAFLSEKKERLSFFLRIGPQQ